MKTHNVTRATCILVALAILFTSCASTTMIQSNPSGAKLYLDGQYKGETPYPHRDTKIVLSHTGVKLTKDGYKDYIGSFTRDEAIEPVPAVVGFFIFPVWLWGLGYNPSRTYDLEPMVQNEKKQIDEPVKDNEQDVKSKADQLRELKKLLDDEIITQEEFDAEKKKILDEDK